MCEIPLPSFGVLLFTLIIKAIGLVWFIKSGCVIEMVLDVPTAHCDQGDSHHISLKLKSAVWREIVYQSVISCRGKLGGRSRPGVCV